MTFLAKFTTASTFTALFTWSNHRLRNVFNMGNRWRVKELKHMNIETWGILADKPSNWYFVLFCDKVWINSGERIIADYLKYVYRNSFFFRYVELWPALHDEGKTSTRCT